MIVKFTLLPALFFCLANVSAQNICGIIDLKIDKTGFVSWKARLGTKSVVYSIEQYRWNKWIKVGEVAGKALEANSYGFRVITHHGESRIRILTGDPPCISDSISIDFGNQEITYKTNKKRKEILFSTETLYEILDSQGEIVKRGYGMNLSYKNLPKGNYTLNYDNTSVILKK